MAQASHHRACLSGSNPEGSRRTPAAPAAIAHIQTYGATSAIVAIHGTSHLSRDKPRHAKPQALAKSQKNLGSRTSRGERGRALPEDELSPLRSVGAASPISSYGGRLLTTEILRTCSHWHKRPNCVPVAVVIVITKAFVRSMANFLIPH